MQEHFQLQEDLPTPQSTLSVAQDECNLAAVRRAPSGIGFIVLNEHSFSKVVLPRYLLHSNYSSFVRQVAPSLPSSTCTTFARSGRPTTRATSSISASTASTSTSWPRSSADPRRRGKLAIRTRIFRVRIRRKEFGGGRLRRTPSIRQARRKLRAGTPETTSLSPVMQKPGSLNWCRNRTKYRSITRFRSG